MLGQIFSSLGGAIGGAYGGGILSTVGRFAGRKFGDYLEKSMIEPDEYYIHHGHLSNMYLESLAEGRAIPVAFGRAKLPGNMIWALPLKEVNSSDVVSAKYPGTNITRTICHDTKYKYFASFALAICKGEILDIGKVWANGELLDISPYRFRLYKGTKDQIPDPLIVKDKGQGKTPAFRDLVYIVFEDLPIEMFGNRVPNFAFEVIRKTPSESLENLVKSIIVGPGIGEFSYDTIVQNKIITSRGSTVVLANDPINSNNNKKIADALFNLDKLQENCNDLEWVCPKVCWFGDNLNIARCSIIPKVESKNPELATSEEWIVAGFNRSNATMALQDRWGINLHNGTVNDNSLVRYLNELSRRGLKTMLAPLVIIDANVDSSDKKIFGSASEISNFFNKSFGYKNFILHYANLVRGKVDAFVIGSGLSSITNIRSGNKFPAVLELIDLARQVKVILGKDVQVTYAADFLEYNHIEDGLYNMDDLWASEYIDVVGINLHLPMPSAANIGKKHDDILQNILDWWGKFHFNTSGQRTKWKPMSKKIWFTEFEFLADKGQTKGAIFPTEDSSNSSTERSNIKMIIDKFISSQFIGNIFFKEWNVNSNSKSNKDCTTSINNVLGAFNLGNVIEELCTRAGVSKSEIETSNLGDMVCGMALKTHGSVLDIINMLRCVYLFDIVTSEGGKIKFIKRDSKPNLFVDGGNFIKNSETGYIKLSNRSSLLTINAVNIGFIDERDYKSRCCNCNVDLQSYLEISKIDLPIIMGYEEAEYLGYGIISSARYEDKIFKIRLPIEYLYLEPTDILVINFLGQEYKLRITDLVVKNMEIKITAVTF